MLSTWKGFLGKNPGSLTNLTREWEGLSRESLLESQLWGFWKEKLYLKSAFKVTRNTDSSPA